MVYYRPLTMDQTEMIDMAIATGQLISNLQGSLMRNGSTKDAKRYVQSAKGQLDKIADKLGDNAQPDTDPTKIRTPEQLANISDAAWTNMVIREKVAVLLEHFAGDSTYDPVMCGFCQDLTVVLSALKLEC